MLAAAATLAMPGALSVVPSAALRRVTTGLAVAGTTAGVGGATVRATAREGATWPTPRMRTVPLLIPR
jgi:hypothetical protein